MKKFILLLFFALLFGGNVFAHEAFKLLSSERKTVKESDLARLAKDQTTGKKSKTNLTFAEREIRLVVVTGPEDDMLSYLFQGLRNPNLVVPSGATLKILFVNVDVDMRHDIRFGHVSGEFPVAPDIKETVGSEKLTAQAEDKTLQAEELTIKAGEDGAYKYFCSVRGHAKGGMWGNIFVGVEPGKNVKTAEKKVHVHSADEDNKDAPHAHDKKTDEKKSVKKPDEEMSEMKADDKKKDEANHQNHDEKSIGTAETTHKHDDKSSSSGMSNMAGMNHGEMAMRSVINVNDPMTRESSGTAWTADSTPMYAWMKTFGNGDMLMLHGTMFARYTSVGSNRDVSVGGKGSRNRFDAPSMFMAMYSHPINNRSQIGVRAMLSLDPIIERGYGYPLLYQSGEAYRGKPIHDRQHPHDFVSELSASYSYKLSEKQSFYFYAGLPGEPALGPPTFMHRLSGMENPDAPISHHWQDSTHITYGVLTAGYTYDRVKFEMSAFKGQEPDENRWNFDAPKLDSFSGRLSFNPTREWSLQISHGRLKNPEPSEPELKIRRRTTASAIYNKNLTNDRNWANTFVWGQNNDDGEFTNAFLFESNYQFQKNSIFGRVERVQKSGHELVLDHAREHEIFNVGLYSLGYVRDLIKDKGIDVGLGAQATFYTNPSTLNQIYGGNKHGGFQLFLRFRPSRMNH
ncbi:MAG: hypothetical protein H0U87_07355 [Acidobacteria bacterium]|nr:hypothetical protein [Acidobacteriota bacterium]